MDAGELLVLAARVVDRRGHRAGEEVGHGPVSVAGAMKIVFGHSCHSSIAALPLDQRAIFTEALAVLAHICPEPLAPWLESDVVTTKQVVDLLIEAAWCAGKVPTR